MIVGEIVKSLSGRDCNSLYIVYKVMPYDYVLLVNGDNKKFENPKLKNVRHLESLGESENLINKFNEIKNIYNEEVYSTLKKFKQELN